MTEVEQIENECQEGVPSMTLCHSCAHVLGGALMDLYPKTNLAFGPSLADNQFFYEGSIRNASGEVVTLVPEDFAKIEEKMKEIVQQGYQFQRVEYPIKELKEKFQENPFKLYLLEGIEKRGGPGTTYKSGPFEDLCRGPHVSDTSKCKFFHLTKITSAEFNISATEVVPVQRIYGVCFETEEEDEMFKKQQQASEREHTKIGKEQELFMFDERSPGSAFFLPAGDFIYTQLETLMRKKLVKYDYIQVRTPQLFYKELWETSGHWAKYQQNMFVLESEKRVQSLKPMNCPGHCLIFRSRTRSYRELPMRMAEYGCCHRNEISGTLHGLSRVRRFTQDDAHIFCAPDGIKVELEGCLNLMKEVYAIFGLQHSLMLSTRPKVFMGEISQWNEAERVLKEVLEANGVAFGIDEGGGAFYGPKIDVLLIDSLGRKIQCATIQLDFQLPRRFNLLFQKKSSGNEQVAPNATSQGEQAGATSSSATDAATDSSESASPSEDHQMDSFVEEKYDSRFYERPVIIHRAILGSFERFIGIITEHYNRKWPFWINPRQALIIPINTKDNAQLEYADKLYTVLKKEHGFQVFKDLSSDKLGAKIRAAQALQYSYILVVGANEVSSGTVSIRARDMADSDKPVVKPFEEMIADWKQLVAAYK